MKFFGKIKEEDWQQIEDTEIEEILAEIKDLPTELGTLKDWLNEFSNALNLLKKNKKKRIVENVHHRARHLRETFKELEEKFGKISKETEEIKRIDDYIKNNFFVVKIKSADGREVFLHFNKKRNLIIGRETVGILEMFSFVSRKHLILSCLSGNKFECEIIGTFPTFIGKEKYKEVDNHLLGSQKKVFFSLEEERFVYILSHRTPPRNILVFSFEVVPLQ